MEKELKLMAAYMVKESALTKGAKLQLLKFIQNEASDIQIKGLLLDGEILGDLDEQATEILEQRFSVSEAGGRIATMRKSYMTRVGAGGGLIWLAYRKIRSAFDACTKQCGKFELNTARRQLCMAKCKVNMINSKLAAAKKAKNDSEVKKMTSQLVKAKERLAKYQASFKKRGASE